MADDTDAISRSRAILAVLYRFGETRFPDSGPGLRSNGDNTPGPDLESIKTRLRCILNTVASAGAEASAARGTRLLCALQ